jgi:hypothetical protein
MPVSPPLGLELMSCGKRRSTPLPTPIKVINGTQGIETDFSPFSATARHHFADQQNLQ